jgi:hypothetical protein
LKDDNNFKNFFLEQIKSLIEVTTKVLIYININILGTYRNRCHSNRNTLIFKFILNFNLSTMQKIKQEIKKTHLKKKSHWLPWQQNNLCLT